MDNIFGKQNRLVSNHVDLRFEPTMGTELVLFIQSYFFAKLCYHTNKQKNSR